VDKRSASTGHGLSVKEKVEKLVPCNCRQCCTLGVPEYFEQKRLLQRKRDNKLTVECPGSYATVNVLELLDGIQANRQPDWAKLSLLRIFISYSHAQRDYFPVFKTDLGQYIQLLDVDVQVFDDNTIPIGAAWDEYLQGKVSDCDVMVLLVSQEFMNSQYIREKEFGSALERLKSGSRLLIAPIYFAPCRF
jgi:internalin A